MAMKSQWIARVDQVLAPEAETGREEIGVGMEVFEEGVGGGANEGRRRRRPKEGEREREGEGRIGFGGGYCPAVLGRRGGRGWGG